MRWFAQDDHATWHLAVERLATTPSGKVASRYLVTACNGRSLYQYFGRPVTSERPGETVCQRCGKLAKRRG